MFDYHLILIDAGFITQSEAFSAHSIQEVERTCACPGSVCVRGRSGSKLGPRVNSTLTSQVLQLPNLSHSTALQWDETRRRAWTHADAQTSARKQTTWSTQICSNYGDTCVRMRTWWLQASCCPFVVVLRQHSTRYHFTGMRSVYDFFFFFYEHKRKHSHKFWQGESMSWLVRLGEREKKGDKRQQGLWLGTRTGIEGSSTYINHSLLIHPFILWDNAQAGPWLGSC